ncbi:RNA 2'-phosphotransferase [Deinococcus maricopensis]|uniref:Probable RNA 2'-phosphotransferase n=1 Tax=Deinococcus maricopensis (strain DSM 21211 / LMG 22137 / NRRL B-23946 / LB-34) TaxID=709986 RepID=E8U6Z7_DEIML|nr:RNA 2'-phosphotransferase [Deinococcus maricopensis]ADV66836.1 RNA 2'-phosphotransferase [Deinococcus maricopensis DSM 21211]
MNDLQTKLSRRLSYLLRHAPHEAGLTLEPGGWVRVDDLLAGLRRLGVAATREAVETVVRTNDKRRFSLDGAGERIRANQGHSVPVDLELTPSVPPDALYHGTVRAATGDIFREGLRPMARHHVHLSPDTATAVRVGARRGRPVVLRVDAAGMHAAGHRFYCSENGVWLTDTVPPAFLSVLPADGTP